SHGSHAYHAANIQQIRDLAQKRNKPIAILGDLQGPKLRVGKMQEGGVPLKAGEELILTTAKIIGEPGRVPLQNQEIPGMVRPGERILLDDGLLEIEITGTSGEDITTRVIVGGVLHDNKGMNLPHSRLEIPSLTPKDIADVEFLLHQQVDWIALSFVRQAQDVEDLRKLIRGKAGFGRTTPIISKIEKPEAVRNIREIIEASDGIMVARGDLGIETSPEAVPMVQKMIITYCNETDVPVITATQMLDSMIRNPRPTRAEASDVANAVLDGSDAIMLSGETASGHYPVRSVETMVKIAEEAERVRAMSPQPRPHTAGSRAVTIAGAVSRATVATALEVNAAAIIAPTVSGSTAKKLAHYRPDVPIIAVTPSPVVHRQLALYWGVYTILGRRMNTTDEVVEDAVRLAHRAGYVDQGDIVLVTGGVVGGIPGATNLMTVRKIARVLVTGEGVGNRRASGRVIRMKPGQSCDSVTVTTQDILVAEKIDPGWAELVYQVGGLITAEPGRESYAALAAVELGIPALVGARGHWDDLKDHQLIVLDAVTGSAYDGTY
ncbi:pyruvate kinase, partial [Nitrosomonas europaea]|uniref:pyruvate kinase n=1 Tax=Nitrosomonas europaea TaxID=915 RepID=UPI003BB59930